MNPLDQALLSRLAPYTVVLIDDEYSIIVPRYHPYLNEVIAHFDEEIAMFRANKP